MNTYPVVMGKLEDTVNEMFLDFQTQKDIASGDITPELSYRINELTDKLAVAILSAMDWQERNCPRVTYEQTYAPDTDMTFILKYTSLNNEIQSTEVASFYCGEPTDDGLATYKDKGTACDYEPTTECTLITQDGKVDILRWGRDDYSAEFKETDYSVRGTLREIMAELRF